MRLVDTSSLKLVTKHDANLPPYAILSHTWGSDSDELTMQDLERLNGKLEQLTGGIMSHAVTKKPGYAKLQASAALARSQGYGYIWIDTCCIDKTSSAELSEAINSMFRWYRDAEVCYVFLDDVQTPLGGIRSDGIVSEFLGQVPGARAIRKSRWFTRGWTLQELIAPSNVDFYSQSWEFLGSKTHSPTAHADFPKLIGDITGIDIDVLLGYASLEQMSVAQRMHWASGRRTTRVEDMAYCLMGIFGVNMPLLYGEGEQAFIRLQVEILRSTTDQSIFVWQCAPDDLLRYQLSGLLAPSPACFLDSDHIRLPSAVLDTREATSAPSTMTNAGLHVRLKLTARLDGEGGEGPARYYAILDCAPQPEADQESSEETLVPTIVLVALGGDQFARVHADEFLFAPTNEAGFWGETEHKYVYVKQFSVQVAPPIRVNVPFDMGIEDVYPDRDWNPNVRIMRTNRANLEGVLGVFRFRVGKQMVDVFVGISSNLQSQQSARYWCYQEPCEEPPIPLNARYLGAGGLRNSQPHDPDLPGHLIERSFCLGRMAVVSMEQSHGKSYLSLAIHDLPELHSDHKPGRLIETVDPSKVAELDTMEFNRVFLDNSHTASLAQLFRTHIDSHIDWSKAQDASDNIRLAATGFLIRTSGPREHPLLPSPLAGLKPVEIKSMIQKIGYTVNGLGSSDVSDLESHFSRLLIETCIVNDIKGATELLRSILSCAKIEAIASFHESHQEEPWTTTIEGFRPLHWATLFGNAEIVGLLLEGGANVTSTTATGMTPVDIAAMLGHVKVLELLVERDRDRIDYLPPQPPLFEHPCHLAAAHVKSNDVEAVLRLLMAAPSESDYTTASPFNGMTNNVGETPLHRAAAMANICAVTALMELDGNIDVNQQDNAGRAALWHASAAGAAATVSFLLNAGADYEQPDRYGLTALHAACRGGYRFTVNLLLEHDDNHAHPKMTKFTPAHFATLSGNVDTLRVLKKHGQNLDAYVEREPGRGIAPAHIAMVNYNAACLDFLRLAGCDVMREGWYHILSSATERSQVQVARKKIRLRKGSDKSWPSNNDGDELRVQYFMGGLMNSYFIPTAL